MCVKCVTTGTTACRNSGLISIDCRVLLFIILFVWLRSTLNIGKGKPQYGHHTREFAELCNTQNKQLRLVYYSLSEPLDTTHFVQRMNLQRTSVSILQPYTPLAVYGIHVHIPLAVYGVHVHAPLAVYGVQVHTPLAMYGVHVHTPLAMYGVQVHTPLAVYGVQVHTPLAVYGVHVHTPLAVYGVHVHTPLPVCGVQVHTPLAVCGVQVHTLLPVCGVHVHTQDSRSPDTCRLENIL